MVKLLKIFLLLLLFTNYELRGTNRGLFAQDKIVVIVNSEVITQKDLNDFLNFMRIQLSAELEGEALETKIQSMKLDLLDRLIEDSLILQEAKKEKIQINPEKVEFKLNEIKKRFNSEEEFQENLTKQGLTQADIESRVREQLLMYNIIEAKVRSKIIVNPSEVTEFFQTNIEKFKLPEQRELYSVAIEDENLAKEIQESLGNSQGLEELAKKYSLTVNKLRAKQDGKLRKDIEELIFKLSLGEISAPIKIEETYYVFQLGNIIPPKQQTLSEVQEEITAFLFNERMQKELTIWLDQIKKDSYIKIIEDQV